MKGYKVFNPDWTCKGKQYSCPGVFEQEGKLKICENGIHFCKELNECFNYYDFNSNNKVAEVEAIGEVIKDTTEIKYCTSKIKIIRELTWHEVLDLVNIGKSNTGFGNSGDNNAGDYNTGHCNSGNYNTGNWNFGNHNTGDCNSGNYNTGYYNDGHHNSGRYNDGNYNTGNYNTGYRNTGHYNFGDYNTGYHNSGDYNTGDFNISNYNTGCFNTKENKIYFFDKPSDWTYKDWKNSLAFQIIINTLKYEKTIGQEWWKDLSEKEKESILNLPNFNANIFKKITGIDVTI